VVLVAKEYILRDRKDPKNVFRWDVVQMNLPGSKDYNPSILWVSKIRLEDGNIAADLFLYVDDGQLTGNSQDEVNQATRVATSRLQKLGVQDAPRKSRRWGSRRPGAWAGSIVEATNHGVYITVSQEKLEKSQRYIGEALGELLGLRDDSLDFKSLESKRGFLIYVTRTYPSMVPYLKGMHLTLDLWRPNRDEEGWKLPSRDQKCFGHESQGPPNRVIRARRWRADLEALKTLFGSATPLKRRARSKFCVEVFYGFSYASGVGSCTNFQSVVRRTVNERPSFDLGDKVYYRYGH
jgi:hypothetical protein